MNHPPEFQSLRTRMLRVLIGGVVTAVLGVGGLSHWFGGRWADEELGERYGRIEATLQSANYRLTPAVLDSLSTLTQTELIALGEGTKVLGATLAADSETRQRLTSLMSRPTDQPRRASTVSIAGEDYQALRIDLGGSSPRDDGVRQVVVLFGAERFRAIRYRAAILPFATGLSVIAVLALATAGLSRRVIRRIERLRDRVQTVADGDFESRVSDDVGDEIGRLGEAVDSMAAQLNQLWKTVQRQESEKLLHQIAGGMAHQLRNSLTGARMAVELHAAECGRQDDESVRVAISQIEAAEDFVRRLVLVASGQQAAREPADVTRCWEDVRTSLTPIANHVRTEVTWSLGELLEGHQVADRATWTSAVTNLVHNAIQAGDVVKVDATWREHQVVVRVADNGAGVADQVAEELFEPFVTTKPEGLGLGLAVVRRAAESLGGEVRWSREGEETVFEFSCPVES